MFTCWGCLFFGSMKVCMPISFHLFHTFPSFVIFLIPIPFLLRVLLEGSILWFRDIQEGWWRWHRELALWDGMCCPSLVIDSGQLFEIFSISSSQVQYHVIWGSCLSIWEVHLKQDRLQFRIFKREFQNRKTVWSVTAFWSKSLSLSLNDEPAVLHYKVS